MPGKSHCSQGQSYTERVKQRAEGSLAQAPCGVPLAAPELRPRRPGVWPWLPLPRKLRSACAGLAAALPLSPFPFEISLRCIARFPQSSWWLLSRVRPSGLQSQPLLVAHVASGLVARNLPSFGWAPLQHPAWPSLATLGLQMQEIWWVPTLTQMVCLV